MVRCVGGVYRCRLEAIAEWLMLQWLTGKREGDPSYTSEMTSEMMSEMIP